MSFSTDYNLDELKLRGLIAFAARCSRRLFPIIVLKKEQVAECNAAISMAESFAAGEPGNVFQVRRIAKAVEYNYFAAGGSYPRTPEKNRYFVRKAIESLADAALSAFSAICQTPPSKSCCNDALKHATSSVNTALLTMEPFLDIVSSDDKTRFVQFKQEYPELEREYGWIRNRINSDFELLKKSHQGNVTELGNGVDCSSRGMLGQLWESDKIPKWYREGNLQLRTSVPIQTASTNEFLKQYYDWSLRTILFTPKAPNIVCWYALGEVDFDKFNKLQRSFDQMRLKKIRKPVLIVYSPEIDEDKRAQLIKTLGAIVFTAPLDEQFKPTDEISFTKLLTERLQDFFQGWSQDDGGQWKFASAVNDWRNWGALQYDQAKDQADIPSLKPKNKIEYEPNAPKADYENVLKYLSFGE